MKEGATYKKLTEGKSFIALATMDKTKSNAATMKKRNEPKPTFLCSWVLVFLGSCVPGFLGSCVLGTLNKRTHFTLCGSLCRSVARKTKQSQNIAFSIENQGLPKKQSQIKPKIESQRRFSIALAKEDKAIYLVNPVCPDGRRG